MFKFQFLDFDKQSENYKVTLKYLTDINEYVLEVEIEKKGLSKKYIFTSKTKAGIIKTFLIESRYMFFDLIKNAVIG